MGEQKSPSLSNTKVAIGGKANVIGEMGVENHTQRGGVGSRQGGKKVQEGTGKDLPSYLGRIFR